MTLTTTQPENRKIEAYLVSEHARMGTLPRHFGRHMMTVEGRIYNLMYQLCVQERRTHSAGWNPAGARIRSLVAWIAKWRETKTLKPIDKAIVRVVANHQAVAQANAYVASKMSRPGGRACNCRAKAA